ncbi:short-chain dehydrogenase/ reductase-like protein [Phyllosticta citriasiana]|uniref:Short-chain dehydrogenase/ reductase-like protein n=1 Tax=Phyllosticta citriasiana TaxID=595635 RepID=A0ABR1L0M2_9PEZI
MGFAYKKVLLVGATSGIGRALADKLVQEGVHVIAVGRRKENLDEFVSKHGKDKSSSYVFDISNLSGIPKFRDDILAAHPDLDCLFLNSGIQRGLNFTKPEKINLDNFELELRTNYISFVHLTVAFLPFFQKKKEPNSIIYTTSSVAFVPITHCPNYCATKAALHQLILVMRQQMKDGGFNNLKIIELYPPAVQTELHDADKQPFIEGGRQIGMPLADFVQEAWEGLEAGKEEIPVGQAKDACNSWERTRQESYRQVHKGLMGPNGSMKRFYDS